MNNSSRQGGSETARKYKSTKSVLRKAFQILNAQKSVPFLATVGILLTESVKKHNEYTFKENTHTHTQTCVH